MSGAAATDVAPAFADSEKKAPITDVELSKILCDELPVTACPRGFYLEPDSKAEEIEKEDSRITPNQAAAALMSAKEKATKRKAELEQLQRFITEALQRELPWADNVKARYDREMAEIQAILAEKITKGNPAFENTSNVDLRNKLCAILKCAEFKAKPKVNKAVTIDEAGSILHQNRDENNARLSQLQQLKPWIEEAKKRELNWAEYAEAECDDRMNYLKSILNQDYSEQEVEHEAAAYLVSSCGLTMNTNYRDQLVNNLGRQPAWYGFSFKVNGRTDGEKQVIDDRNPITITSKSRFNRWDNLAAIYHMKHAYHGCGFYRTQALVPEYAEYFQDNYHIGINVLQEPPQHGTSSPIKAKIRLDRYERENKDGYGSYLTPQGYKRQWGIIEEQLKSYPQQLLQNNPLRNIFIVDELSDESGEHQVYGRAGGNTMTLVQGSEGSFHHEYFHILDGSDGLAADNPKWTALNPNGSADYPFQTGDEAAMHDYKCNRTTDYQGFASCYGKNGGPDEDQAEIATALFNTEELQEIMIRAIKDPVLLKKIQVISGCMIDTATGTFSRLLTLEEYKNLSGFDSFEYYPKWTNTDGKESAFNATYWNSILNANASYSAKYQRALKKKDTPTPTADQICGTK